MYANGVVLERVVKGRKAMNTFKVIAVFLFLIMNAILDYKYKKIPCILSAVFAVIGIICVLIDSPINWLQFLGILVGIGVILTSICTKQAIGLGDGLVLVVIGLFMGLWKTLMILFIAGILVAIIGGLMIVLKKGNLKTSLPFIPFLLVAYGVYVIL